MAGPAEPFALGDGPDACLLLHGLTGSPAEVRPVGEALAAAGFRAVGPLLPGHGTTPADLDVVTRADLLEAARSSWLSLAGSRRVFLCGLSAGALLAIHLAARTWAREGLPDLAALALLAPAVEFAGLTWVFTELVGRLPSFPLVIGKGARDLQGKPPDVDDRADPGPGGRPDGAYDAVPLRWGTELRLLRDEAVALAHRVHAPALVLHGARDRTTAVSGSRRLARLLGSRRTSVQVLPRSGHVLPLDVEADEVCRAVLSFFEQERQGGA